MINLNILSGPVGNLPFLTASGPAAIIIAETGIILRRDIMELKYIREFVSLAETGSYFETAERLFITKRWKKNWGCRSLTAPPVKWC